MILMGKRPMLREYTTNRSPAEEPVRVVPFFRLIEVETMGPAFLRFRRVHGLREAVQEWRGAGHAQVPQQTRDEERHMPVRPPEIGGRAFELLWCKLAEDDIRVLRLGKCTVADNLGSGRDESQLARVAVVNLRRSDARQW